MRLIAQSTLVAFAEHHPQAAASLLHWRRVVKDARWSNAAEVQAAFSKAKALGGDFRLVCAFDFRRSIAFVKFIGSHADYDKIDALTVKFVLRG